MISLDRFSHGTDDPQEQKPLHECDECKGEIYLGDSVYSIDGFIIHEHCLGNWAQTYFQDHNMSIEDALEVE